MPQMLLPVMSVAQGKWHVAIANDQNLWVEGIGIVRITRLVHGEWLDGILHGVSYILKLRTSIFSIGKAANGGVVTSYHKHKYEVVNHEGKGRFLLTTSRMGRVLYELNIHAES